MIANLHQGLHTDSFCATFSKPVVVQSMGWLGEGDLLEEVDDAGVSGIVYECVVIPSKSGETGGVYGEDT